MHYMYVHTLYQLNKYKDVTFLLLFSQSLAQHQQEVYLQNI